jgi:predicted DNA-binding WGR domain protein
MTALTLRRSDPVRKMHRYYRLDVQLDLFGAWCFIREWGRIGQAGQTRTVPYPTSREAQAALERQRRAKERRGYLIAIWGCDDRHRCARSPGAVRTSV